MNRPPAIRSATLSLWTLGHRSYYSPMLRVAGGFAAYPAAEPRRARETPGRCRAWAPLGAGTTEDPACNEARFPDSR